MCPNCEAPRFLAEAATNDIRGGIIYSRLPGDAVPRYAAPIAVVRAYCEATLLEIDQWLEAENGRVAPMRQDGAAAH